MRFIDLLLTFGFQDVSKLCPRSRFPKPSLFSDPGDKYPVFQRGRSTCSLKCAESRGDNKWRIVGRGSSCPVQNQSSLLIFTVTTMPTHSNSWMVRFLLPSLPPFPPKKSRVASTVVPHPPPSPGPHCFTGNYCTIWWTNMDIVNKTICPIKMPIFHIHVCLPDSFFYLSLVPVVKSRQICTLPGWSKIFLGQQMGSMVPMIGIWSRSRKLAKKRTGKNVW